MSTVMEEEVKRWTARRKSALELEVSQDKTTVAEASRAYDLPRLRLKTGCNKRCRHGKRRTSVIAMMSRSSDLK